MGALARSVTIMGNESHVTMRTRLIRPRSLATHPSQEEKIPTENSYLQALVERNGIGGRS
jgi:hypothetical protein